MQSMSKKKASEKKPKPMYIPAAALKRFANELESDVSSSNFLQLNRERVSEFIEKQPDTTTDTSIAHESSKSEGGKKRTPGIYDYSTVEDKSSFIELQSTAEFRKSLGPRSRFGEGDGSFFDQWLNSDVAKTKCVYDKDGFPIMKFSLSQMQNGFKKCLHDHRTGQPANKKKQYVQSYAERREQRLKREREEKTIDEQGKDALPPILSAAALTERKDDTFVPVDFSVIADTLDGDTRLPAIDSLSAVDKSNYFGNDARAMMFDYYRHIARQRLAVGEMGADDVEDEISAMHTARSADTVEEELEVASRNERSPLPTRREPTIAHDADDSDVNTASPVITPRTADTAPSTARSRPSYSRIRRRNEPPVHVTSGTKEERRQLIEHLEHGHLRSDDAGRPLSARSKFLLGCVQKGIVPQPSLIIRKHLNTMLSIPSLGIGNDLADVLASSLSSLPILEGLNVADNNLTDKGLVPIVQALTKCEKVKSLDISRNKVDADTADALRKYLSQPGCSLTHLIMQNANVDDYEASRFMEAIGKHNTVIEIDLSQNLLGSHELALNKEMDTAGVSIGALLETPACSLRILKLTWNMIRFQSAVALMRSLKINTSLTYLDVSYNGLNLEGGEMLGDALHYNKSLHVLKIAHNNITSRPCCTILSGILSCTTLTEVDMSENPIGEEGARALLSVNLHHGQRVVIDIRGCSLRVKDPLCWFDALHSKDEYTLRMDQPYERCICIELLRMVARTPAYTISSFLYTAPGESAREIELATYSSTEKYGSVANLQTKSSSGKYKGNTTEFEEARNMFRDAANRIFHQYDLDDSGGLDREEICILLQQMGLEGSVALVDKLMTIYDTDGSGLVEEEEFISFLMDVKATQDQKDMWNHTDRFIFCKDDAPAMGKKPSPYMPPDQGSVTIKLNMESTLESSGDVISQESVEAMLSATKTVQDSGALFEYALKVMKLNFGEAQTFFRVMLKEIGSVLQVMLKLLPRMATPADARMLVQYVTNHDFEQTHYIRTAIGNVYRVYIGLPNGYYQLNLAEPTDRECLESLAMLSNTNAAKRKREDLGDTSQLGDWSNFRNVALDGQPFQLTREWLMNIPSTGKFECDFVSLESGNMKETEISNLKLFRLMVTLGMTTEDKRKRIFAKLTSELNEGRAVSKGNGLKRFEFQSNSMEAAAKHVNLLFDTFHCNRKPRLELNIDEMESQYLRGSAAPIAQKTKSTSRLDTAPGPAEGTSAAVESNSTGLAAGLNAELDEYSSNPNFVREMMANGSIPPDLIGVRCLEVLENALAGRYLTCVQLGLLVNLFPYIGCTSSEFHTLRVELVVSLFSKLVDIINFDYVLRELETVEYAMIVFRLGWLNIWNPLKAEGHIQLDLSRREERQLVRILVLLNFSEDGPTWQNPLFRPTRTSEWLHDWQLSIDWFAERTLPKEGIVKLHYFSGRGKNLMECAPDPKVRLVLMALVLAQPYIGDIWSEDKNIVANADALLDALGGRLSFRTERQFELEKLEGSPRDAVQNDA